MRIMKEQKVVAETVLPSLTQSLAIRVSWRDQKYEFHIWKVKGKCDLFYKIVDGSRVGDMLKLDIGTFKVSILFHQCGAGKDTIPKQPMPPETRIIETLCQRKRRWGQKPCYLTSPMICCNLTFL